MNKYEQFLDGLGMTLCLRSFTDFGEVFVRAIDQNFSYQIVISGNARFLEILMQITMNEKRGGVLRTAADIARQKQIDCYPSTPILTRSFSDMKTNMSLAQAYQSANLDYLSAHTDEICDLLEVAQEQFTDPESEKTGWNFSHVPKSRKEYFESVYNYHKSE
ncbi:hypothetical protein GCM10009127_13300 [Alteraurantiacibacter aestuarii]|uniref:Uncharacterized protein n=1 Tax=Alteraurantiacibacter aestuarii TaxID=650004 RepID=A0A844ZM01_9SPHN|nr:hypothetical protein [Alteraurantiacibacter aestuarii]MXO88080.1 hypothetical protein [Alteraurantiacibacter aestuarii]